MLNFKQVHSSSCIKKYVMNPDMFMVYGRFIGFEGG